MSSSSLSLDILRLRDRKSQLKLYVDTTLRFGNAPDLASFSNQGSLLDTILCRQWWVARGSFCHLDISVIFNGSLSPSSSLLNRLGQYICSAPVWAQLGLSVTVDGESTVNNRMRILLDHDRYSNNLHIQSGVSSRSIADVRPPDKTPVIELEQISIVLDFHIPFSGPSHPIDIDRTSPATPWQRLGDCELNAICNEDAHEFEDPLLMEMLRDKAPPSSATCAGSSQLSSHSEMGKHFSQSQPSTAYSSTAMPQEEQSELTLEYEKSACNTVELALRMLIGGKQIKRTAGMRCIKPPPAHSLSELAPALFNPGFLKALAERSHLISPLKQTLSRSLLAYAQSPFLRQNVQQLNIPVSEFNKLPNALLRTQKPGHQEQGCLQTAGDRLWQLAQRILYNDEIARRLKSLGSDRLAEYGKVEVDVDPNDDFDMLDIEDSPLYDEEGQVYFGADKDEFEDLLQSDGDDFEGDMDSFLDDDVWFDNDNILSSSEQLLRRSRATSIVEFDDQGSRGDNSSMLLEEEEEEEEVPDLMIPTQSPNPRYGTEKSVEFIGQLLECGDATEHMLI